MKLIFQLIFLLFTVSGLAQEEIIFIKAGTDASDELTPARIYRFPAFKKGTVFFRDGTVSQALMNYNFLNGEIEFIDPKGDTLAIAKAQLLNVRSVRIDTSSFYFNEGYLEELVDNKYGKLLQKQVLVVKKREKIGGYNQPSETSAIDSYSSYSFDGQFQFRPDLKVRENITLGKRVLYYFGDQYNVFLLANKKNLLRIFSKHRDQINNYLKSNEVDFAKYDDLQKLFAFIQTM